MSRIKLKTKKLIEARGRMEWGKEKKKKEKDDGLNIRRKFVDGEKG